MTAISAAEEGRAPVLSRTLLALLRSYGSADPVRLAMLVGRPERDIAAALAELQRDGLISSSGGMWTLSPKGLAALLPETGRRPSSVAKYRPASARKIPAKPLTF